MISLIFGIAFFLILAGLTFINFKLNEEFKIEPLWLVLALSPLIIWLIATEQLSELSGFGFILKLNESLEESVSDETDSGSIEQSVQILNTQEADVMLFAKQSQWNKIPFDVNTYGDLIEPLNEIASAGQPSGLPFGEEDTSKSFQEKELSKRKEFFTDNKDKIKVVILELGKKDYYDNDAIKKSLTDLAEQSFFKFVIFQDKLDELKGIILGVNLLTELQGGLDLVARIEYGDISCINGVITTYVQRDSSKKLSLQLMEKHGLSFLPVVDNNKSFIGTVDRDKIINDIILQIILSSSKTN